MPQTNSEAHVELKLYWVLGNFPLLLVIGVATKLSGDSIFDELGPGLETPIPGILWLGLLFYSGASILHMFDVYDSIKGKPHPRPGPFLLAGGIIIFSYRVGVGPPLSSLPQSIIPYVLGQALISLLLSPSLSGVAYLYKLRLIPWQE